MLTLNYLFNNKSAHLICKKFIFIINGYNLNKNLLINQNQICLLKIMAGNINNFTATIYKYYEPGVRIVENNFFFKLQYFGSFLSQSLT